MAGVTGEPKRLPQASEHVHANFDLAFESGVVELVYRTLVLEPDHSFIRKPREEDKPAGAAPSDVQRAGREERVMLAGDLVLLE